VCAIRIEESGMRTLIMLVGLLALTLTPAAAQKSQRKGPPAVQSGSAIHSGARSFRGDPDPFIQGQLLREQQWRKGGS
jgi:hypothetical protein